MATNKHAIIRYHALDKCFSNFGRRYFIDDLIYSCNKALNEFTGSTNEIKRRQIFDDIRFMESEQGWSIPLDRLKDGKKIFYKYLDKNFSIKKQAINETEVKQLKETVSILNRFKGMPQFEWMEELLIRIESTININKKEKPIVGFDQNQFLKGLNYFTELFNAILYKKVLVVKYQSFKQPKPVSILFHPYYLKQYNNRWFLFGYNEERKSISNLSLDRIIEIKEKHIKYIENETIDFEEYFDDIFGVTIRENLKPCKIILQVSKELWPYIESKPIHGSQKIKEKKENFVLIELFLQINYEIISHIFAFGENIKVVEPYDLKVIIKTRAKNLLKNYL